MVRLITTLLLCLFVGITANASQITEQQALQVAAKYADIDIKSHPQRMKAAGKQQKTAAYYAFNIGDNEGFIIVSGDDSLTELVGYSDSGSFDLDKIPDNMRSWLQSYSDYVKSVQDGESRPTRRELGDVTTVVVRPFVTTAWNQSEPFNLMAPVDNNVRCVTGCVATAMAQVMKYYEWPERGEGSHSYTDSSGHSLSADFSQSVYDWGNMLDEYNSYYDQNMNIVNEYNDVQADAVAKLMLDCGISVDMDYTLYSSGAVTANVATALEQYFNYTADLFYRDNMPSEDFMGKLFEELDNRRPILFSGKSLSSGHAFVGDGYDSNNFVHINWGWGGLSNGFFNVNYLDPDNLGIGGGTGAYQYSQFFIASYPNYQGKPQITEQMSLGFLDYGDYAPGIFIDVTQFPQDDRQTVSLSNVHNPNADDYSGEIGVAAFGTDGNMTVIHTYSQQLNGFPSGTFYPGSPWSFSSDFSTLAEGEYQVCGISKQNSSEYDYDWIKFNSKYCINIKVEDGIVTVIPEEYNLSLAKQIEKPEKIHIGQTAEFIATLRNSSSLTAEGTVDYVVRRLPGNEAIYSSSVDAIVYDYNDYATNLSVTIGNGTFDQSTTYSIEVTGFTLSSGETIPVESEFGQCTFTIEEGTPQRRLTFYDNGPGNAGISLNTDVFEKSESQDVNFNNIVNYESEAWQGYISTEILDSEGEAVILPYASTVILLEGLSYGSTTVKDFSPDMGELPDGLYTIIPVSQELNNSEWVRFDHPSKIDIEIKGDYAYVRHYEYSISQESEITAAGELTSGGTGVFNVEMRNNSEEEAVGDLSYEIRKQADGSLAYEGTMRIDLPAYTTSTVSIEQPLTEDIFSEGAYTIAITGYLSATHTDFSYSSAFQPSAFLIGTSGADAIEAANVTVYPNPAKDFITVDCGEGISSVTIFSASGQLVKSIGGADAEGSIHIGNLPAGYYIVAVDTESGTTVRKQILKH